MTNLIKIRRSAEEFVRSALRVRPHVSASSIVGASHVGGDDQTAATRLLDALADVLRVDVGQLRPDDELKALCRVPLRELGLAPSWYTRRLGVTDTVEVFSYEIFAALERIVDVDRWGEHFADRGDLRTEEDWLDFLLSLTVTEYLRTFAPVVRG